MATNLFLILFLRVGNYLGEEYSEDIFEKFRGESHASPIVPVFQDIQHVAYVVQKKEKKKGDGRSATCQVNINTKHTIEVYFSFKVRVVEDLHGNLVLALVQFLHFDVLNGNILLNVLAGEKNLLVLSTAIHAVQSPVRDSGGDTGDDQEEEVGLETTATDERKEGLEEVGNDDHASCEVNIVECAIALGETDQRGIFNGRQVGHPHSGGRHVGLLDEMK